MVLGMIPGWAYEGVCFSAGHMRVKQVLGMFLGWAYEEKRVKLGTLYDWVYGIGVWLPIFLSVT